MFYSTWFPRGGPRDADKPQRCGGYYDVCTAKGGASCDLRRFRQVAFSLSGVAIPVTPSSMMRSDRTALDVRQPHLSVYSTGWPKNGTIFLYALSSSNINRFSKLFHCQNQEKICNNTITKDPTTPQVCRYTTLWNVRLLKATIENKTTSVTTHFKKLTTGNNVFIVSVIVSKVAQLSHLQFLHQMFNVSTLLLEDALKPATPLTNGAINETHFTT